MALLFSIHVLSHPLPGSVKHKKSFPKRGAEDISWTETRSCSMGLGPTNWLDRVGQPIEMKHCLLEYASNNMNKFANWWLGDNNKFIFWLWGPLRDLEVHSPRSPWLISIFRVLSFLLLVSLYWLHHYFKPVVGYNQQYWLKTGLGRGSRERLVVPEFNNINWPHPPLADVDVLIWSILSSSKPSHLHHIFICTW